MSNKSGVVYIQRDKFDIYSPALGKVLEFRYVPEIIKDLDVVNKSLLEEVIKLFAERATIPQGDLIFILADNACFIKDFVTEKPEEKVKMQDEAKAFIEHTPFDNVSSKIFQIPGGVRVFTTNKDIYRCFKSAFEKQGFKVNAVIPGFLVGNNMSLQPSLTPQMAHYALLKENTLRQYNLLVEQKAPLEVKKETNGTEETASNAADAKEMDEEVKQAPDKKRLFILVGVFVVLIIFTVVFYFIMYPPK